MILLFTSARDSRPLYRRDLLNVCCEAKGTRIRFGYDEKWIAENLRSKDRLQQLGGTDALIIYCEQKNRNGRPFTYHPIRKARIVNTIPEHQAATFEIELDGFFNYDYYIGQIPSVIETFQEYILRSEEQPTPSNPALARFVRDEIAWERASYSSNWLPLIRHVRELEGLNDCYFFSVQKPDDFGGKPDFILPKHTLEHGRTTYQFKGGKSYEVNLHIVLGNQAVHRVPSLTIKESVASVSGPFVRQRSSGLQADFILHCKRSFDREQSLLSMTIPCGENQIQSPEIQALINFDMSGWIVALTIISLAVGWFLGSLSPDLIKETALSMGLDPSHPLVLHPITYTWWLKMMGFALFAWGAYLGVRKMPVKF